MKFKWTWVLALAAGCAGGQGQPTNVASLESEAAPASAQAESSVESSTDVADATAGAESKNEPAAEEASAQGAAKQAPKLGGNCTPKPDAEPKVATGDNMASDIGDTGRTFVLNVAGINVELPPCTPQADTEVLELSWETQERPTSSHVHPKFERHGATVRLPFPIKALEGSPLRLRFNSHRPLRKSGQQFVAAVEFAGECEGRFKRDPMEFGGCSHWRLFQTEYDPEIEEMVAEVPEVGGYRIQFGWMPKGWTPEAAE